MRKIKKNSSINSQNDFVLEKTKTSKSWLIFLILGIIFLLSGAGCFLYVLLSPEEILSNLEFPSIPSKTQTAQQYDVLTGNVISDASLNNSPTFCMQVPNGLDISMYDVDDYYSRYHVGLDDAKIVFEAIAEAGITRFATIFQNPTVSTLGPIRSLRIYYLDWDVPFDCTIVHAGGSIEAINAVKAGGYRDLTESAYYMWRNDDTYTRPNNLFTSPSSLIEFNTDYGYESSNPTSFTRLTPEDSNTSRIDTLVSEKLEITTPSETSTSKLVAQTSEIHLNYGYADAFNVVFQYDTESNTYKRFYEDGSPHYSYHCETEDADPRSDCGDPIQLSPSVVIAMVVEESLSSDGVHEAITTIGSNTAYVFQNGVAIKGTWSKSSREDQIKFYDESGAEIALAPGQTWISAVPYYGSIEY